MHITSVSSRVTESSEAGCCTDTHALSCLCTPANCFCNTCVQPYDFNVCVWCRLSMTTDRPARFTFQLVQLSVLRVSKNVLHTSCLGCYCKYQALYKQCSSLSKPMVWSEQYPELQQLICLACSSTSLVKLTVCCQAMARPSLQVPPELLAGFQQLKDKSAQQTVVTTQHSSNPASLPACQVPSNSFGYGLNTIQNRHLVTTAPLAQQSEALHSYYTTLIRLDRPGH